MATRSQTVYEALCELHVGGLLPEVSSETVDAFLSRTEHGLDKLVERMEELALRYLDESDPERGATMITPDGLALLHRILAKRLAT